MKRSLFVLVFFLLGFSAFAQPKLHPIGWSSNSHAQARTAATTPFSATLKLPFIHDFSVLYYPIDSIFSVPLSALPVSITTHHLHGLSTSDAVSISGVVPPNDIKMNGVKYVKVLSDYTFELYDDVTLITPIPKTALDTIKYARIKKAGAMVATIPDPFSFYNDGGGAMISPGFGKNPISYYTVSFDGLNEQGVPYNLSNPLAVGDTDSLKSQPIDLQTNTPADSIYMSFFVERGGIGEAPNVNDFLYLSFLDNNNEWHVVWSKEGSAAMLADSFYVFMVGIKDPIYFHDAFQFKFHSVGRQSGSYDIWNLNYIYIATNRTIVPTVKKPISGIDHKDFSIAGADQSILNTYTAMPYNAFFTNPAYFLKDKLSFNIVNQLKDSIGRSFNFKLIDNFGTQLYTSPDNAISIPKIFRQTHKDTLSQTCINVDKALNKPLRITQIYSLYDSDLLDYNCPTDFMFNNVLTCATTLHDYYAYDDGEAEYAFGSNNSGSKIAVEFQTGTADILTDIDIAFAESNGGNLNGLKIYLIVWNYNRTRELRNQQITIQYASNINGFTRYHLNTPVSLDSGKVFNIGYQQNFSTLLTFGYDRNNDHTNKINFYTNGLWKPLSNEPGILPGSLMFRPVFSHGELLTGIEDKPVAQKKSLELYPNPTADDIHIVSQEELHYKVYSLYGQEIETGILSQETNNNTVHVLHYVPGMYIIVCTDRYNNTYTARFIKE